MSTIARRAPGALVDALLLLVERGTMPVAGAIDLAPLVAAGLERPAVLVDVRQLAELRGVVETPTGDVRIGAAVTLAEIGRAPLIHERFPLLASASAWPPDDAVRELATLGGTLSQRPRCPYFRSCTPCLKTGGTQCPAVDGENRALAILEGGPCYVVHPADVAVALVALDAVIELASARGVREIDAGDFFVLPTTRLDRETALADDELVLGVRLPASAAGGMQRFTRRTGDDQFALVSLASARRVDGEGRLVLGGVSPRPYRVYTSVEEEATSGGLDDETIEGLAERALLDVAPLSHNGFKVDLAAELLREAIRELASS